MKKIGFLFATLIMLMLFAFSTSALEPNGQCGEDVYWNYDSSTGELVISGNGAMTDFSYDSPFYNSDIKSVIIKDGVTSIGHNTFFNCYDLEKVIIADSVTIIGKHSFHNCNFDRITIPNGITIIDDGAFYACYNLKNVTVPDSVTTIGKLSFAYCDDVEIVAIGKGVTTIGESAFLCCRSLKSISVDSSNKLYLSDINGVLFNKEKSLLIQYPLGIRDESYTLPNSVTIVGESAFGDCEWIKNVTIPDSVITIESGAFSYCYRLENITVGSGVTTIGENVFLGSDGCIIHCYSGSYAESYAKENGISYNLISPNGILSNGLTWEVTDNSLTIRGNATSIPSFERGKAPWSKYANKIEKIYIFADDVKTIGSYAFYGLNNVNSISIGSDGLSHIMKYAFYGINADINISFVGTETQWKNISIDYGNDTLIGSDVRCSGTESTVSKDHISVPSKDIDEETFFEEHLKFANDETRKKWLDDFSFYNNVVIKDGILKAYYTWEIIGDLGELLTFKVDDLTINADYYEMYLADIILALNSKENYGEIDLLVSRYYKDISSELMDLLKNSDELDEDLDKNFIEEMQEFFSGKNFELSTGAAEKLEKLLKDNYKNNKDTISSVFEGLSTANKVLDVVFKSADIVNGIADVCNAYVVSKAFYEVNSDFYDVCREASEHLLDKNYQKWFLNAVDKAEDNTLGDFDVVFDTTLSLIKKASVIAYESISQNMVKAIIYPGIGKLLGVTSGQLNVATLVYNTTYGILDACFKHSEAAESYKMMNYITPLERSFNIVVQSRQRDLLYDTKKDDNVAKKYDLAYRVLRETNMYLYDAAYNYASIKKHPEDMKQATLYKYRWNILKCHYRDYGDEYTLFSAHCPVDVYVYDSKGQLVTSIVNEETVVYSSNITVTNSRGNKTVAYPSELEYSFVIKAREDGTMDYSISKGTSNEKLIDYKSYDIPLTENQEFSVTVPTEDSAKDDYKLNTEDTKVDFDYDYHNSCQTHSYGDWSFTEENKSRKCSVCGYIEQEVICKHNLGTIKAYSIVPTCTTSGHTKNICSACGTTLSDGEDVDALGHDKSKLIEKIDATCTEAGYTTYTCFCGDTYTSDEVPALGHTDSEWIIDTDSTCSAEGSKHIECTVCEEVLKTEAIAKLPHNYSSVVTEATCKIGGYTTYTCTCGYTYTGDKTPAKGHDYAEGVCKNCGDSKVDNCSCNCHKGGFSGLIWKILRFFYKIFKINPVCACGVAHY